MGLSCFPRKMASNSLYKIPSRAPFIWCLFFPRLSDRGDAHDLRSAGPIPTASFLTSVHPQNSPFHDHIDAILVAGNLGTDGTFPVIFDSCEEKLEKTSRLSPYFLSPYFPIFLDALDDVAGPIIEFVKRNDLDPVNPFSEQFESI